MKKKDLRSTLMTKALTLLGFSSPMALMACYGTPTTGYPSEVYIEEKELGAQKGDSASLSIVAEGRWEIIGVPDFVTLSQEYGEGSAWITVKALDDNLTGELREGYIDIRVDGGADMSIAVAQLPEGDDI